MYTRHFTSSSESILLMSDKRAVFEVSLSEKNCPWTTTVKRIIPKNMMITAWAELSQGQPKLGIWTLLR